MMTRLILIGAATALAVAGPAFAKPGHGRGHGAGGCPPGLAKKAIPCMPPGQAKKLFGVGQRVPYGYDGLRAYNALPYDLRSYYGPRLDPYSRYVYDRNYIYRVDPRTMLVQQILSAIIRR